MAALTVAGTLLLLAGLLVASAFFSSSETAIFSLSQTWLAERAADGDADAVRLADLREDPHRLLVTLLVGNNAVNVAISSLTTLLLVEFLPPAWVVPVATVVVSSVVLVCGEIVPKSYGLGNAETWSLRVVGPVAAVERLLYPLVVAFDVVTRAASDRLGGRPDIEDPFVDG